MKIESHLANVPFSMTPDAEDYLRDRLGETPPQALPVLMMTESQSDGLNPPRWCYKGRSFVLDYVDGTEGFRGNYTQCKLLGHCVAIESDAMSELSGRALSLRRVAASRGLLNVWRYVLVTDSAPTTSDTPDQTRRVISIAAMSILGGFTGMGVIWVVAALVAGLLGIPMERLFSLMPILFVVGWIIGAIVSFYFFRGVFTASGRTKFAEEQRQRKYLGYGGLGGELSWYAFLGIPVPLTAILVLTLEPFARTVGEKSGVAVGAIVAVFAAAMYFCDRLPQRLVFRLGLLGWVITVALGFWYFKTYGP